MVSFEVLPLSLTFGQVGKMNQISYLFFQLTDKTNEVTVVKMEMEDESGLYRLIIYLILRPLVISLGILGNLLCLLVFWHRNRYEKYIFFLF